jgi:hypothetical protein
MNNPLELPQELVAQINPIDARRYAAASGWRRVPRVNGTIALYDDPASDLDQLIIPLDSGLSDYAQRMSEVVVKLASRQHREPSEILEDLLLPPSDVMRFRRIGPGTRAGDIDLEQGIALLTGARRAILSAGCSVIQPQSFHPRLSRAEAEQLVHSCRLGQTERGSFTAVIACPLDAVGLEPRDERPLFATLDETSASKLDSANSGEYHPTPFTRQVTSLLMRSLARITHAVDQDREDDLHRSPPDQPPLSANLCEALLLMQPDGDRSSLAVTTTWARTLPPPPGAAPPSHVHLRQDYFPTIQRLAVSLRPKSTPQRSVFVGLVDLLDGDPDLSNRVSGDVQILILNHDKEKLQARVTLNPDDYHKAWEAHGTAGYVKFQGVLNMGGRNHRIVDVSGFDLLKD